MIAPYTLHVDLFRSFGFWRVYAESAQRSVCVIFFRHLCGVSSNYLAMLVKISSSHPGGEWKTHVCVNGANTPSQSWNTERVDVLRLYLVCICLYLFVHSSVFNMVVSIH